MKRLVLLALFSVCCSLGVMRDAAAQSPAPGLTESPAATQSFDPAAATQAWLDSVPAEKRAQSDAYFEGGYWLILWDFLLSAAISLFLLGSGLSARLRDFAERTTSSKTVQVALYMVPYMIVVAILSFPLAVYRDYFREHAYGLATQTFAPWFQEQLIGLCISIVGLLILTMVLYAIFRRAQRTWWIWGAGVGIVFSFISILIAPVFIEPLFNTYKPLADPKISESILAMARANEIPVHQVFEVDASRQSTRVSANVSGVFGTARIALNDNLLKQCTLPEIRAVMAHEMGHYVLNHVWKLIMVFGILIVVGFALLRVCFDACVRRWGPRWGVHGIADLAGFPPARADFWDLFCADHAAHKYRDARDRARGRRFRHQHRARGRRVRQSRAQARRLSQTRSRPDRGIYFLRSPERPGAHPHGDGLEGGKFARGRCGQAEFDPR